MAVKQFEQYINQKQMGAYYTKEDISEYIAQNTIIPFLFSAAEKKYPTAFEVNGPIWRLLREHPDRYIYEAVRCESHLPAEADQEYAARRKRYAEIKARLLAGKIVSIDDIITYNLDIRRFAMDVIENCERDFLRAFYESLEQMTILDPTCGSGAFLLAALKMLEPLYEDCIERLDITGGSRRYLILKSIILNNLYGVDISKEAIEICKLGLLLKLVACIECKALYYHNCPVNWIRATTFVPGFRSDRDGTKVSSQIRQSNFQSEVLRDAAVCIMNSTLFFWFWLLYSDCYHLTEREIGGFPVNLNQLAQGWGNLLSSLSNSLMLDYKKNTKERTYVYTTTGRVVYDEFYPKLSKPIINEIDRVLARYYGFSEEELDFIIHYEIKYRMGRE